MGQTTVLRPSIRFFRLDLSYGSPGLTLSSSPRRALHAERCTREISDISNLGLSEEITMQISGCGVWGACHVDRRPFKSIPHPLCWQETTGRE